MEGWLLPGSGDLHEGAYFGNHDRFFFTEAQTHYVVTLHYFGRGTLPLLDALVAGLRPLSPLPTPVQSGPSAQCPQGEETVICKGMASDVAVGDEEVWVTRTLKDEVVRISLESGRPVGPPFLVPYPTRVVADGSAVWVVGWRHGRKLFRLDPDTGEARPVATVGTSGIAIGDGVLWVTDGWTGTVKGIEAETGREIGPVRTGRGASGLAVGAAGVWVANTGDGTVARLEPETGQLVAMVRVGNYPQGIAVGAGSVWVTNTGDGTVSRVDPATNRVTATIRGGVFPMGVTVFEGSVWVTNFGDGTISRIDPSLDVVVGPPLPAGPGPFALSSGGGALWIGNASAEGVLRVPVTQ